MKRALLVLAVLFTVACFPYRETRRPEIDGAVVDAHEAPLAHVRVEVCSKDHWHDACAFRTTLTSDVQGRFHVPSIRTWDWCCLGEAPLPYTLVAACDGHGGVAKAFVDDAGRQAVKLVVQPGPLPPEPVPEIKLGQLVKPNDDRRPEATKWANEICQR